MSRAKQFTHGDVHLWFDYRSVATVEQLELLADLTGDDLDDLLDAGLTQKEVARRLFSMQGFVPEQVLENRRKARESHATCRWCEATNGLRCDGRITRHHYVPRWMMLELENYNAYAPRRLCTIPMCLGRHRDLHLRDGSPKSIVEYLNDRERAFAEKMISELREEHPRIFDLLASGDEYAYEGQLIRDYLAGEFRHPTGESIDATADSRGDREVHQVLVS